MSYVLGKRSKERLEGVHPDLVAVVERAITISSADFTVLEGVRTRQRQKELFDKGASKTMNSRHLTGHAVDLAPWPISWDWEGFVPIVEAMRQAADELGIVMEHGYDWGWDAPHHQLSRKAYP